MINEATALLIDHCVASVHSNAMRDVLVMHYVSRLPDTVIAIELGCHRRAVELLLKQAETQVEGKLLD